MEQFVVKDNSRFSLVFLLRKLLGTVHDGTTVLVRFWIKNYENQSGKHYQSPINPKMEQLSRLIIWNYQ